ncbi:MAG: aminoglycoside 6-adenylyltransferase [Bifidobacteriaceae bacterium]|nr:aminoglycoside 6-adenylyltransferase [Bifidobacteriaceae bacterium]
MAYTYDDILDQLAPLLAETEAVAGAAAIGSRASSTADSSSDLDVLVFAQDPEALLADTRWLSPLGRIWAATVDRSLPELPVRRILLDDAVQLDLLIVPVDAAQALGAPARRVLEDMARRGFAPVKAGGPVPDGLAELAAGDPGNGRPSQDEFAELVSRFWIDVVRSARRLTRGEVWGALRIIDGPLKDAMVQMQAWIVKAVKGADVDTYWSGRHLGRWAGDRFHRDLAAASAGFDGAEAQRALIETMDQFRLQAIQAAQRWSLDYPEALDRRATVWVRTRQ